MNPDQEREAKDLYFQHDGSLFYMSRDGTDATYLRCGVPKEIEAQWLEELTAQRLQQLDEPGNRLVLHFLVHHGDYRHLEAVLGAVPKGKLWERCAFLETLIKYLGNAFERDFVSAPAMQSALDSIVEEALKMRRRSRSDKSRHRIDAIVQDALSMKNKQGDKRPWRAR